MPPSPGYQNVPMWRPPQVSVPFASPSSLPSQFISPGHGAISGYGGGYHDQFSSPGSAPPSALAACYTPGSPSMNELSNTAPAQNWFLDSGATNHVTSDLHNIQQPQNYTA